MTKRERDEEKSLYSHVNAELRTQPAMQEEMSELTVHLGERSYAIHFADSFDGLSDALEPFVARRVCAIVSNPTVWPLYGEAVASAVAAAGGTPKRVLIPDGELYKNLQEFEKLLDGLVQGGLDRSSVLVALGGGVVGDVAGFAASAFMRGIPYIQIPTTLLAQVDSSVGGKTGVNLSSGKNLAGAFYQPRLVFINWNTLTTLPLREIRAGYAEVIKYGMIADADLFELLEERTGEIFSALTEGPPRVPDVLGRIIRRCCEIKAEVVAEDERERGRRAILNYGHTFAHAVESLTKYETYVHGEAVAIGMHAAAVFAGSLGMCDERLIQRQSALLNAAGLSTKFPSLQTEEVIAAFYRDKKTEASVVKFVLPRSVGNVEIVKNPDLNALKLTIEAVKS